MCQIRKSIWFVLAVSLLVLSVIFVGYSLEAEQNQREKAVEPPKLYEEKLPLQEVDPKEEVLVQKIQQLPNKMTAEQAYLELEKLVAENYRPLLQTVDRYHPQFRLFPRERKPKLKKIANVLVLFDSSNAVYGKLNDQWIINHEKLALIRFAHGLPKSVKMQMQVIGGHQACRRSSLVTLDNFNQVRPKGSTALARGLRDASSRLTKQQKKNVIFLIAGAADNCEGNAVQEAKNLREKKGAEVHVISLSFNPQHNQQLKQIAQAGGGQFYQADSAYDIENNLREQTIIDQKYYMNSWKVKNIYAFQEFQMESSETIETLVGLNPYKSRFFQLNEKEQKRFRKATTLMKIEGKIDQRVEKALLRKVNERYKRNKALYEQKYREKKRLIDRQIDNFHLSHKK